MRITAQVGKASADGFTRSNPLGATAEEQAKFNENDVISVKADDQDAVTYKLVGSEWQPQGGKFLKWENKTMTFTAYYPATFNGTITQPTEYTSLESLAAADFMSFTGEQSNTNGNNLTLTMKRQMARVVVDVVGFNDQYDKNTPINSVSICGVTAYKHKDDGKFYALIKPCEAESTSEFLSLKVGANNAKETLTGIPALEAGNSYTYKLTVGKNKISVSGITVKDWTTLEITGGKAIYAPYVTFTAKGEQKFKMTTTGNYAISGLQYSVNNGVWQDVVKDGEVKFGGSNGTLRLRGTNPNGTATDNENYSTITFTNPTVNVACTGDMRTLLDWQKYNTLETGDARFCYLFSNCSVLTSAPKLRATTLADNCYVGMFSYCTNLSSAPELPAIKLAGSCYEAMFKGCTNLSTVSMLAPSDQITNTYYCCKDWLYNAGTVTFHVLKVKDADAYNALASKSNLPAIWKKDDPRTTVLDENYKNIE